MHAATEGAAIECAVIEGAAIWGAVIEAAVIEGALTEHAVIVGAVTEGGVTEGAVTGALHDVTCLAQHGGIQGAQLPKHHPQAVDISLLTALLTHQLLCMTAVAQSLNSTDTFITQRWHSHDTAVAPSYAGVAWSFHSSGTVTSALIQSAQSSGTVASAVAQSLNSSGTDIHGETVFTQQWHSQYTQD